MISIETMGRHWRRRRWRIEFRTPTMGRLRLPSQFTKYSLLSLLAVASIGVCAWALIRPA